jgi:poly(hydroxyalkanoate) depolymerase family esterase
MARRARSTIFNRSIQRTIKALTRSAVRAGTKAVTQALHPGKPAPRQPRAAQTTAARPRAAAVAKLPNGFTAGLAGAQRYRLFMPTGVRKPGHLPLLVMLHGCTQSSEAFAASTRMNQIAAKEGFAVLYPEQNHLANLQGCWNWHQTRSGTAQTEADAILATILQVYQRLPIDLGRIALAGLSAGASMAALLAIRHPARFRAIAMHSGIAPGMAQSLAGSAWPRRCHPWPLARTCRRCWSFRAAPTTWWRPPTVWPWRNSGRHVKGPTRRASAPCNVAPATQAA